MKTNSNTYSAGAILDNIPEYTREKLLNLIIHPQHEDTNHRGGVTFDLDYMGVVCRYKVIHTWADLFDLETVVFRYFNVYGERHPVKGQYAPVIGIFIRQKNNGEKLTIVGDGRQTRDFIHVSDLVNAVLKAAYSKKNGEIF